MASVLISPPIVRREIVELPHNCGVPRLGSWIPGPIADLARRAERILLRRAVGRFSVALVREIADDDLGGMAAEMAYRFLFALVPSLLLVVTALGFLGPRFGLDRLAFRVLEQVRPIVPGDVHSVLLRYVEGFVREAGSGPLLVAGLVGALWGASGGVRTLVKGLNRAYDIDHPRPLWRRQLVALVTASLLPLAMFAAFVLASVGRALTFELAQLVGWNDAVAATLLAAQLPVTTVLLALLISLAYLALPALKQRYIDVLPGSAAAAFGFVALTQGFGLVARGVQGEFTFRAIGTVFAFLLWLHFAALVLLIGAEVNALLLPRNRARWQERG